MNFQSIVKLSLISLKANKTRSALTMLGIIIGISSVIIIMSVGAGAQSLILNQIEKVGSNLIGILPGAAKDDGPPASAFGITVTTLTYDDAMAILRQVPEVIDVSSFVQGVETVAWQNQKQDTTFIGTTGSYIEVEDTAVAQGRFFNETEEKGINRLAVLGSQLAVDIFADKDPIGEKIKIGREAFEVIGVMKERGTVAFQNPDDQVFIPVITAQRILLGIHHLSLIRAKVGQTEQIEQAITGIKEALRNRHNVKNPNEEDFDIRNQAEALDILTTITSALNLFLAAIAAISLLVGGIGIMNIMFVSVNERIKEIGLRKAVGANRGHLLSQFLIEAIIITVTGGIIGIIFGAVISGLVAFVANYLGYSWKYIVSPMSIIVGLLVAGATGLIFGYFPAKQAADLDPIDALRYE